MNTGYLIYQAERPRSPAEQRQVDIAHAELARWASRRWHALAGPVRTWRLRGRPSRLPAGYQAEGRAGECLTGQHA